MLTKYFTKSTIKVVIVAVVAFCLSSCRKFVTIDPPTQSMVQATVFGKASTTAAALQETYNTISNFSSHYHYPSIYLLNALYPDEYRLTTSYTAFSMLYTNAPDPGNAVNFDFLLWNGSYSAIYSANAIIEGLEAQGGSIVKSMREQLMGEAKFLRAFTYFMLVNTYGDVPLLLTTDHEMNRLAPRSSQDLVYEQIINDLKEAQGLMQSDYLDWNNAKSTTRLRANKETVDALLARVYLYRGDWVKAETHATAVIDKTGSYALENIPANAFNASSKETIWAFDNTTTYPRVAFSFSLTSNPNNSTSTSAIGVVSDTLLSSFEAGDNRRRDWIGVYSTGGNSYYFANKFKVSTTLGQYYTAIRLPEMYLIRAEARLEQGLKKLAIDDLNVIRARARGTVTTAVPNPLPTLSDNLTIDQVRVAMEKERFTELFIEGHRWFDIKRWKGLHNPAISRADEAMPAIAAKKGVTWQSHLKLLPIPQKELDLNSNLIQNTGY